MCYGPEDYEFDAIAQGRCACGRDSSECGHCRNCGSAERNENGDCACECCPDCGNFVGIGGSCDICDGDFETPECRLIMGTK